MLRVSEIIGGLICVATEDGEKIYEILRQAVVDNVNLMVSFANIEVIVSAFLNVAVGRLYGEFSKEEIESTLSFVDIDDNDKELLHHVVANAIRYYRNRAGYDSAALEVLEYA